MSEDIDDKTFIQADIARKAIIRAQQTVKDLLSDRAPADQAAALATKLGAGTWMHDYGIMAEEARAQGLPIRLEMPAMTDALEPVTLAGAMDELGRPPDQVVIAEFHRFEGMSDPDDMAILYALETRGGVRGTLADAFGVYADPAVGAFMHDVGACPLPSRLRPWVVGRTFRGWCTRRGIGE